MKFRTIFLLAALVGLVYASRRELGQAAKPLAVQNIFEAPAQSLSYRQHADALRKSSEALAHTWEKAPDTPGARQLLRHVISLEKWSQARLEAVLSDSPAPTDEAREYEPDHSLDIAQLRSVLMDTRAHSASLADSLHRQGIAEHVPVRHNGLGPMTPKAWLRYMQLHATAESMKLPLMA